MNARKHVICLAAYAAVFALGGGAYADRDSRPAANVRLEQRAAEPMSSAQARQLAWFKQESK
jgi:hypothetical protein